jgi:hypothetical protein
MTNRKMNLDRPNLNSEQISAKQNFEQVLSKHLLSKPPVWKSPWFWGPTGLASIGIALFFSVNYLNSQNETHDNTNTLAITDLPKDTECIHPPIEGENVPFQTFEVNPNKNEEIILPSGTKIEISKESLLPENKNEKVEIEVREFPDKVSTFLAGIPMDYQKEDAFISAGMIEIRGKQNDQVVEINSEKPIKIDLKMTKNPAGFDFWCLNETIKDWTKYPVKYELNHQKEEPKLSLNNPATIKKQIANIDDQIVALNQLKSEVQKPSVESFKIPNEFHQKFDLDFNKKTYPELAKFENLVFEILPTSGYDKNFTKKTWSDVKLEKNKEVYEMIFTATSEKLRLPVRPVLQGKELTEAKKQFDVAITSYNETTAEIEKNKSALQKQKEAYQKALTGDLAALNEKLLSSSTDNGTASFQVNQWGVYNCDKPSKYPSAMKNEPFFVWENSSTSADFSQIFVFNLDKDLRFNYGDRAIHPIANFGFHANDDLVIFGVERGGDFGVCELKSGKSKNIMSKIIFKKGESGESVKDLLNKLMNETVSV